MKWEQEEINIFINCLKNNKTYFEISLLLNRTAKAIKSKAKRLKIKFTDFIEYYEYIVCKNCNSKFEILKSEKRTFCNSSCAASFNNKLREKMYENINCLYCNKKLSPSYKLKKENKYCNHECKSLFEKNLTFKLIESGDLTLNVRQYKKYLIELHGEKCMECGWCEINKKSNKIPIQLEHIDGNYENNSLLNLKLLCPNCHSLTPTFGALNMGNGRQSRKQKYKEEKSY